MDEEKKDIIPAETETQPETQPAPVPDPADDAAAQRAQELRRSMAEGGEIERQMSEIRALDPRISSIQDILKLDTAGTFRQLVARGYTLVDAFRIANGDALRRRAAEARRQAELNSRGKSHLRSTRSRGAGTVTVPREVKNAYRELMPNATDMEILAHYNRYKGRH